MTKSLVVCIAMEEKGIMLKIAKISKLGSKVYSQ